MYLISRVYNDIEDNDNMYLILPLQDSFLEKIKRVHEKIDQIDDDIFSLKIKCTDGYCVIDPEPLWDRWLYNMEDGDVVGRIPNALTKESVERRELLVSMVHETLEIMSNHIGWEAASYRQEGYRKVYSNGVGINYLTNSNQKGE